MKLDQEYTSSCRKKLEKALLDEEPFLVTHRKISMWFNILNDVFFEKKIPKFNKFKILKRKTDYFASCNINYDGAKVETLLEIYRKFQTKKDFLEILAHEMIHLHDHWVYEDMAHGKRFFKWKKKFNELGLRLQIKY